MTTVKMPRQHNQSLHELQRQKSYLEDAKEVALTIGYMFFFMMCLWAVTALYDFGCELYLENHLLKNELREEKAAFKLMFMQDALDRQRGERERQEALKKLCKRDELGCKIMMVQWGRR